MTGPTHLTRDTWLLPPSTPSTPTLRRLEQRRATFADLPVQLAERIVLLIAHCWTLEDKPSLANLARVSRAIHTLVQPILVRYVVITDSNVSRIRAVAHLFRSTRALTVQHPGLKNLASHDFYLSLGTFPALDLYVGPMKALYALLRYSNPERIVTRTVVELQDVFSHQRLNLNVFSRLTHLRVASPLMSRIWMHPKDWASLRVTHLMVDLDYSGYYGPVEVQHIHVLTVLASLLAPARLPRLERLCVLSSDSEREVALRKSLESYPPLRGETRLWLAMPDDENCHFVDPFEDEYWRIGTQVYCGC